MDHVVGLKLCETQQHDPFEFYSGDVYDGLRLRL